MRQPVEMVDRRPGWRRARVAIVAATLALVAVTAQAGQEPTRGSESDFTLLRLQGAYIKWGAPRFGSGATVSYALLTEARRDPDAINCKAMTRLEGLLSRAGLDMATFTERLTSALALWQSAADITFVRAASPETSDIVIGAQAEPRGVAYTNIQSEPVAGRSFARLGQATVCLNPMATWRAGGTADDTTRTFELSRVLAHEIGHAVGLDHPGSRGVLMAYSYQEELDSLTDGDIAGIVRLYGVRPQSGRTD
ncbi:matrixin family metalloprotease [Roseospira marina]|nr:matrixin family metalloprotease [Roseospira marina]MBB4315901.1 hypothetical protein [Roseospira marina]MBB5089053.1 hypothetical protein [Roseospira marina]